MGRSGATIPFCNKTAVQGQQYTRSQTQLHHPQSQALDRAMHCYISCNRHNSSTQANMLHPIIQKPAQAQITISIYIAET
jgi:hypothetical protein